VLVLLALRHALHQLAVEERTGTALAAASARPLAGFAVTHPATEAAAVPPWYRRVLRVPSLAECSRGHSRDFVALTLYSRVPRTADAPHHNQHQTDAYGAALARLLASCERVDVC
jgi:hypothetical protein